MNFNVARRFFGFFVDSFETEVKQFGVVKQFHAFIGL